MPGQDRVRPDSEIERYEINSKGSHPLHYFDDQTNQWLMFYWTNLSNVSVTDMAW